MTKFAIYVFVATLGLCAFNVSAGEPATHPQDSRDAQLKALQAKVQQQEAIIRDLSEKLAQAKAQASQPLTLKYLPLTTQAAPMIVPQQVPEGWVQRQFNGVPYYVIPLDHK